MRKKIISVLSISLIVVMVLAGCTANSGGDSGSAATPTPDPAPAGSSGGSSVGGNAAPVGEHSKTFTVITGDAFVQIDPHNVTASGDVLVQNMCYEPLINTDHYGNYTGILAESWEINDDWTAVTFQLRQGVQFSNGEDFNADVAVYNIERGIARRDEFAPFLNYFQLLESVEKIDDYSMKMIFSAPFPDFMSQIQRILMIPMKAHQELGDQMFPDMKHSGTGPWIFDEWVSGQYAHLTKNPNYWDKANYDPYFEDGYVRFVTEQTSAVGSHMAGEADVYCSLGGVGYDILPLYAGSESVIEIMEKTDMTTYADIKLGFTEDSPIYDAKVREALNLCLDRQSIADNVIMSGIVPLGIFPNGVKFGYSPDIQPYEYNPERAKQLLAESSYDGGELSMISMSVGVNAENYALAIASMMEEVGFKVNVEVLEQAAFNDKMFAGEWDIFPNSNMFVDGNIGGFLGPRYISDYSKAGFAGPDNDYLVGQCQAFLSELDPAKRDEIAIGINEWMRTYNGPELAVAMYNAVWAQTYGISGVVMYPDTFWNITRINWDPALAKA